MGRGVKQVFGLAVLLLLVIVNTYIGAVIVLRFISGD